MSHGTVATKNHLGTPRYVAPSTMHGIMRYTLAACKVYCAWISKARPAYNAPCVYSNVLEDSIVLRSSSKKLSSGVIIQPVDQNRVFVRPAAGARYVALYWQKRPTVGLH